MRRRWAVLAVAAALAGCSSGPLPANVAASLAEDWLVPSISETAIAMTQLEMSVAEACESLDADAANSAEETWLTAKQAWDRAQLATYFGPADMLRTVSKADYEPVDPDGIEALLASDTTIDVEYVDDRIAATSRGLGTVEYLLFGRQLEPRRCELAVGSAQVAAQALRDLEGEWVAPTDGRPSFTFIFTADIAPEMALANVVGAIVETLKRQSLFELGKALGETSTKAQPDSIPEGEAGAGADRYIAQLEGIEEALKAGGENSLGSLIAGRSADVSADIEALLDSAIASLESMDAPLRDIVETSPDTARSVYRDVSALTVLFEADVVSLLDITLGFSDADGDTG